MSGGLLERHVQPRRTLQRAASLRGQRGCSYRAAWRPTINHAVDRIRLMLGARFQRSAANQGIWRLTATRPELTFGLSITSDRNASYCSRPSRRTSARRMHTPLLNPEAQPQPRTRPSFACLGQRPFATPSNAITSFANASRTTFTLSVYFKRLNITKSTKRLLVSDS